MLPINPAEINADEPRRVEHAPTLYGTRVVCTCGDFNCASLDGEPRRVEPDTAYIDIDDLDSNPWINEHGIDMTPGQTPSTGLWI